MLFTAIGHLPVSYFTALHLFKLQVSVVIQFEIQLALTVWRKAPGAVRESYHSAATQ